MPRLCIRCPLPWRWAIVPHQVCEFHIRKELTKAVLWVLARLRKRLAAEIPTLPRGRTSKNPKSCRQQRAQASRQRVTELFEQRYLFVRHHLTAEQRATVRRLTRGQRHLRALRAITDEVYRLFDRCCRTETALTKLAQLRRHVLRYRSLGKSLDKLYSSNLEKALTFLDDKLLPETSNAVERDNGRLGKMQKTVYRVRTQESLQGRLALDLQSDQRAAGRQHTLASLHRSRP